MTRLPRLVGLVLCKRLAVDLQARHLSVVGLFHALTFSAFPAPARFSVYTALYGGSGEGRMKLRVTRLETEDDVYSYERWWAAPGQGFSVHVEIGVTRCAFPAPGRYALSLSFDDEELISRYLDIFTNRGPR